MRFLGKDFWSIPINNLSGENSPQDKEKLSPAIAWPAINNFFFAAGVVGFAFLSTTGGELFPDRRGPAPSGSSNYQVNHPTPVLAETSSMVYPLNPGRWSIDLSRNNLSKNPQNREEK